MISQSTNAKQNEILQAALQLFVKLGFHGTPTSLIAKEAGVANGTLFHYYGTKDQLIVALYIHTKKQMTACMPGADSGNTIADQCRFFYTNALRWGLDNPTAFRFLQQFMSSPYVAMLPPEFVSETHAWLQVVHNGIASGIIRPLPEDLIVQMISSHLFGASEYLLAHHPGEQEKEALIQTTFDMLWRMIATA